MNFLNRRGFLRFLQAAPAAVIPTAARAEAADPLDKLSCDECRHLWNEHLSLADSCKREAALALTRERRERLVVEIELHTKRFRTIREFAVKKFGPDLPQSCFIDFDECVQRDVLSVARKLNGKDDETSS